MFAPLGGRTFDLIAANPPYVPGIDPGRARGGARAWEAGADGRELLDRFLEEAPSHLAAGGRVAVVHSSIIDIDETLARLAAAGLEGRIAAQEEGRLGPLMSERVAHLERHGLIDVGQSREVVAVVEGVAARDRAEEAPAEPVRGV
jgi:release factor glutamine methyltransferase